MLPWLRFSHQCRWRTCQPGDTSCNLCRGLKHRCTDKPEFAIHPEQVKGKRLQSLCGEATQLEWHPGQLQGQGQLPASSYFAEVQLINADVYDEKSLQQPDHYSWTDDTWQSMTICMPLQADEAVPLLNLPAELQSFGRPNCLDLPGYECGFDLGISIEAVSKNLELGPRGKIKLLVRLRDKQSPDSHVESILVSGGFDVTTKRTMGNPKGNVLPLLLTDAVTLLNGVGKMTDTYLQNIHKHAQDEHIAFPEGLPRYVKTVGGFKELMDWMKHVWPNCPGPFYNSLLPRKAREHLAEQLQQQDTKLRSWREGDIELVFISDQAVVSEPAAFVQHDEAHQLARVVLVYGDYVHRLSQDQSHELTRLTQKALSDKLQRGHPGWRAHAAEANFFDGLQELYPLSGEAYEVPSWAYDNALHGRPWPSSPMTVNTPCMPHPSGLFPSQPTQQPQSRAQLQPIKNSPAVSPIWSPRSVYHEFSSYRSSSYRSSSPQQARSFSVASSGNFLSPLSQLPSPLSSSGISPHWDASSHDLEPFPPNDLDLDLSNDWPQQAGSFPLNQSNFQTLEQAALPLQQTALSLQQSALPLQQSILPSTHSPQPPRSEMNHVGELSVAVQSNWDAHMIDMLDELASDDWGIPAASLQDLNGSQDVQDDEELPHQHFKRPRQESAPAMHVKESRARGQLVDNEVMAALQEPGLDEYDDIMKLALKIKALRVSISMYQGDYRLDWLKRTPDQDSQQGHCIQLDNDPNFGCDEAGSFYCLARITRECGKFYHGRTKHGTRHAHYGYKGKEERDAEYYVVTNLQDFDWRPLQPKGFDGAIKIGANSKGKPFYAAMCRSTCGITPNGQRQFHYIPGRAYPHLQVAFYTFAGAEYKVQLSGTDDCYILHSRPV